MQDLKKFAWGRSPGLEVKFQNGEGPGIPEVRDEMSYNREHKLLLGQNIDSSLALALLPSSHWS